MANTVLLKRSATPAKVPTTGQMSVGELAFNTYDGKLYGCMNSGTASVVQVGGAAVWSFSGGTTGLTPSSATSGAITLAGTLAVANGGTGVTSSTGSGSTVLSAGPTFTGNTTFNSTGTIQVPVGTTAQRPTAVQGMIRYNTTRGCFEGYTGSAWVNMSPLTIDDLGATA
jgi:hypothetical protein